MTDEQKQKMAEGRRKKGAWNRGMKMPKGYSHCGFQKGNKLGLGNKYMLGRTFKHSEETKLKLSVARKNRKNYIHTLTPKRLAHIKTLIGETAYAKYEARVASKEKRKQYLKDYNKKNKDNKTEYRKNYLLKNRARYNFHQRLRNYKRKNAGGEYTETEWESLKKKYNYMCLCCKKFEPDIKLSADHITPISKGGSSNISNIQPLCKVCNSQKYTYIINYIEKYNATTSI